MLDNYFKNKKGQVASTTTWIVATIIIVVVLLIFYYVSSVFASKGLIIEIKQRVVSLGFAYEENFLMTNNVIAYLLTPESKRQGVDDWAGENELDLEDYIK